MPKTVANPLEQARHYAHQVIDALGRDAQLVHAQGSLQGKVCFPWSYGVVLTNITRKQFEEAELGGAIESHRVVCNDEMNRKRGGRSLPKSTVGHVPHYVSRGAHAATDRSRALDLVSGSADQPAARGLFGSVGNEEELPDLMRVMDLQQEQLARSLGEGHRVIHGVAGSG